MFFSEVKVKLLCMFEENKLKSYPNEWGFFNEYEKNINIVGYASNLTPDTIEEASKKKVDLLITHHDVRDFVFGMKSRCNELLCEYGIIAAFFHLPLDDADFGTGISLAKLLELKNYRKAMLTKDMFFCAVICECENGIIFEHLVKRLSNVLKEHIKAYKNNDRCIRKICIVTGGGESTADIRVAVEEGCDAYITGGYSMYSQLYAKFAGINLFVGSHTNTEIFGVRSMAKKLVADTDLFAVRVREGNY